MWLRERHASAVQAARETAPEDAERALRNHARTQNGDWRAKAGRPPKTIQVRCPGQMRASPACIAHELPVTCTRRVRLPLSPLSLCSWTPSVSLTNAFMSSIFVHLTLGTAGTTPTITVTSRVTSCRTFFEQLASTQCSRRSRIGALFSIRTTKVRRAASSCERARECAW